MSQAPTPPRPSGRYGFPEDNGRIFWALYDGLASFGVVFVKVIALFNKRLAAAVRGRKGGVSGWRLGPHDDRKLVMIHAASRGEFEAVIPLIERLTARADLRIAVSFSSPSVEKQIANHPGLSACGYLPFDRLGEQLRFLTTLGPHLILVAKHDLWPNMIRASAMLGIPVVMINGNFHARSKRHWPVIKQFNRTALKTLAAVYTVSEAHSNRVSGLLSSQTALEALGDTRYDQTILRAERGQVKFESLGTALGGGPVVVAGSCWPPEEQLFWPAFSSLIKRDQSSKLIVAPHELTHQALERNRTATILAGLRMKLYSEWQGERIEEEILYIDRMGVLADVYSVGWCAIVGGGFGVGLHSVLEPAAHGLPVMFGPNHHVSHEASLLLQAGAATVFDSSVALEKQWIRWLDQPDEWSKAAESSRRVVSEHSGATERVMERLSIYLSESK